jgi:hypothetical protein
MLWVLRSEAANSGAGKVGARRALWVPPALALMGALAEAHLRLPGRHAQAAGTPPKAPRGRAAAHLASGLEVFWTGRGGSLTLVFLLLSFGARALIMGVGVGLT